MTVERADVAQPKRAEASERNIVAPAAGRESAEGNRIAVAADTAQRALSDQDAVKKGILPPQPEFFDSKSSLTKPGISSSNEFSQAFNGMKPGEFRFDKDGRKLDFDIDRDGTQHRKVEDSKKGTTREEVVRPDGSTELTTSGKGFLETTKWDADGKIREQTTNKTSTPDGKFNITQQGQWDANGKQILDNKRWQDNAGQWHEDNTMNLPDGTKIQQKMDGDRTTTRTTRPDGSWENVVKTMNVDQVDPATGKHRKTMTIDRTESGK